MSANSVVVADGLNIVKIYKEGDVSTPVVTTYTNSLFTLVEDRAQYSYAVEDVNGEVIATGACVPGNNYAVTGVYSAPASTVSAQIDSKLEISPLVVELLTTPVKTDGNVVEERKVHIYGSLYGNNTATIMQLGRGYCPIDPISITALRCEATTLTTGITSISCTSVGGSLLANGLMQLDAAIKGLEADRVNTIDIEYTV